MDDAFIVAQFFERDESAIEACETAYGKRLMNLATNILKSNEDAQECVNDTYLKAWNSIPPQSPTYLFAYLAKICRFAAFGKLDWKNAKKRKAEIVELTHEMELCIPDCRREQSLALEELGQLLNVFLDTIAKESRLIFLRRYWYADSIYDISTRYGISQSKVKTQLYRTRGKLKDYLESEGFSL